MSVPSVRAAQRTVFPAMYGEAFRFLVAGDTTVDHVAVYDKVNAAKRTQRRVVIVAGTMLLNCDEDGNIKRCVQLSDVESITLCEVRTTDTAAPRVCVLLGIPIEYDLALLPQGEEGQRAGPGVLPVIAQDIDDAMNAASCARRLQIHRTGRFAGTADEALTMAQLVDLYRLRKPSGWVAKPVVLHSSCATRSCAEDTASSESDESTSVVEVVDVSPARRALSLTRWTFTSGSGETASGQTAEPEPECSACARVSSENASLRREMEELRQEVAFWRAKFLSNAPSVSDSGSVHIAV